MHVQSCCFAQQTHCPFCVLVNRPKNAPLFTLLNQLGPVYVEVADPR